MHHGKRILSVVLFVVLIAMSVLSFCACGDEKEPYDVIIEIYNPYTNELMARNKNKEIYKEIFCDTIEMKKSDPRYLEVKWYWQEKDGAKHDFTSDELKEIEKSISRMNKDESVWCSSSKPVTLSGLHNISVQFNWYDAYKKFKGAELSFNYNVTEV